MCCTAQYGDLLVSQGIVRRVREQIQSRAVRGRPRHVDEVVVVGEGHGADAVDRDAEEEEVAVDGDGHGGGNDNHDEVAIGTPGHGLPCHEHR